MFTVNLRVQTPISKDMEHPVRIHVLAEITVRSTCLRRHSRNATTNLLSKSFIEPVSIDNLRNVV